MSFGEPWWILLIDADLQSYYKLSNYPIISLESAESLYSELEIFRLEFLSETLLLLLLLD